MSPAKGVGCLKTPRGFKSLLLRQTFENPCKSLKRLFTRIFLCFLCRFWVVAKTSNFYKSSQANVKRCCITLAVTHNFFLTKRWYVVYTVNADGGAVAGYFDIVKWVRLFFFLRIIVGSTPTIVLLSIDRQRSSPSVIWCYGRIGRVTGLSRRYFRVQAPVASPAVSKIHPRSERWRVGLKHRIGGENPPTWFVSSVGRARGC